MGRQWSSGTSRPGWNREGWASPGPSGSTDTQRKPTGPVTLHRHRPAREMLHTADYAHKMNGYRWQYWEYISSSSAYRACARAGEPAELALITHGTSVAVDRATLLRAPGALRRPFAQR